MRALAWRSRHLWRALRETLDGAAPKKTKDQRPSTVAAATSDAPWTDRVYAHPLISGMEGKVRTERSRISRIPTPDFAKALVDLIVPDAEGKTSVEDIRAKVVAMPDGSPIKKPLLAILTAADGQMDKLLEGIGSWFDARMTALSARYKRNVKWVLVGLGLVVAISFNVDAIEASHRLYRDTALRSAVARQATDLVATCAGKPDEAACARTETSKVDPSLTLPVGWAGAGPVHPLRVFGWLIAAIALGQGAPFWFDLLRRAGNLRT